MTTATNTTAATSFTPLWTTTGYRDIGNSNNGANAYVDVNFFPGDIAKVDIYNNQLTGAQVQGDASAASGGTVTPEPLTLVLLVSGLAGLLAYVWRKRR